MIDWLTANWTTIVFTSSAVLGGLVVVATAIAPLTENTIDDKAAKWLQVVKDLVDRLKVTK